MKLLPKLPVCPHCQTVYRYGDVKKRALAKQERCYHCKKTFKVKRKRLIIMIIELLAVYAALNAIAIIFIKGLSFPVLFAINLIPTISAFFLFPYYIDFNE